MNSKFKRLYSNLALLTTALILGLSFVAQKAGMDYVGPLTFNTCRAFLGVLSLLPIIFFMKLNSLKTDKRTKEEKIQQHKTLFQGGMLCGLMLFLALTVNQFCMIYAPAGKAGFITSLYIIFVPLFSVFLKKRLRLNVKISVFIALIGLYFLCYKGGSPVQLSDLFLLVSSIFFALHILTVSYFSHRASSIKLSCVQFLTVGIISMPLMFLIETPSLDSIIEGIKPILFSGVVVTGVAYTLQTFGQKNTSPVVASLLLSLESVFAVLGGMIFLHEVLSIKEIIGCMFMITAIVLSQLRFPQRFKKKKAVPAV